MSGFYSEYEGDHGYNKTWVYSPAGKRLLLVGDHNLARSVAALADSAFEMGRAAARAEIRKSLGLPK